MVLDVRLDFTLNVSKNDLCLTALRAISLKTINTRVEWLHTCTDGSLLDFTQGAGAGVFCDLFAFYSRVSPHTTHYDGKIEAIHLALHKLSARSSTPDKTVILSDLSSALQSLASNQGNPSSRVQDCRELLSIIPINAVFH
ncbi:hypothetical protein TNCV_1443921 [Trichonephila clavipes]|nr:hypothetical protein TNCV_1443921 [Trichonephila clavipes]